MKLAYAIRLICQHSKNDATIPPRNTIARRKRKKKIIVLTGKSASGSVRSMKRKTKTVRICEKLHSRIKKHVRPIGMKLEAWTEKQLETALAEQRQNHTS